MEKNNLILLINFIFATILGIYGQWIAYFLNEIVPFIHPTIYLTMVTTLSLIAYFILPIIYLRSNRKNANTVNWFLTAIGFGIGIATSIWSLFVLIMWWG